MVADEDKDLLLGLIYGVLHESEPVSGAAFAAKIAVCARITQGNADDYAKAVKKALVSESNLPDLFPEYESTNVIRLFLRSIRRARMDAETLEWLGGQFETPQSVDVIKEYLHEVERVLANNLKGR